MPCGPSKCSFSAGRDEQIYALKNGTRASADVCVKALVWRGEKLHERPSLMWSRPQGPQITQMLRQFLVLTVLTFLQMFIAHLWMPVLQS